MIETNFSFETLDVPSSIKSKLIDLRKDIELLKRSRKGSSGWLFFGKNRIHNQLVAIKFYDWGGDPQYHAEPENLASIQSEHVIKILDASFVDADYAYFVTPYYQDGDLDEEICKGIKGNLRAISLARDILSGLSHLHSKSLLHRDLKPQNILISDKAKAVIGDFGSVKKIPEGSSTVPGSGHSLIYRPPESVNSQMYGVPGDIYQVGAVLFQLLGGHLPYEESVWLNSRELKKYRSIQDDIDRQVYANDCIKNRIARGRIVDLSSLPSWACTPLRRTLAKACNVDPTRRYQSCSEFLARLSSIRGQIHDWKIEGGLLVCYGNMKYRIVFDGKKDLHFVQKDRGSGWRRDNSFTGNNITDLVHEIEERTDNK